MSPKKIHGLIPRRLRRYLVIGVSVYIVEVLVIISLQKLGASSLIAVAVSFWVGLLMSFALQKLITFGDKRLHHKILLGQFLAVCLLVAFNFVFTLMLTAALDDYMPAVACRTLALAITTLWNFYLYKTFIFNPQKKTKAISKSFNAQVLARLKKRSKKPAFANGYLILASLVLVVSTLLWGVLGVLLQQNNADQLVNAYLFQDWSTFHTAYLPDQHSFLVKWPIFLLIRLAGLNTASYILISLLTVLLTVGGLVYILSRIEKRPIVLGTILLAMSSVLLMIPAQPYAGGLLPVNMAMVTTRNIEYLIYIAALYMIVRTYKLRNRQFWFGVLVMGLLMASDKLFLSVSFAGASLAIIAYSLRQRWKLVSLSVNWLVASILSGVLAILLLGLIGASGLTHIVSSTLAGPYGFAHGAKALGLGAYYAITGTLTNFGANPVYDALTFSAVPKHFLDNISSVAAYSYFVNLLVLLASVHACLMILFGSLNFFNKPKFNDSQVTRLALLLIWSVAATLAMFVASKHYYVVDARYLTLTFFGGIIGLAVWFSDKRIKLEKLLLLTPFLLLSIIFGSVSAWSTYQTQNQAIEPLNERNQIISKTLSSHKVDVLVGDYWRVMPTKFIGNDKQKVMPLADCTTPRPVLTSEQWQPNLKKHSFAYLLTLEGSLTDYPNCTLDQVEKGYGLPNSSALIAGTLSHPKELLLFYDHGLTNQRPSSGSLRSSATVLPINLEDVMHTSCPVPTVMNIVAHQDDDLLFMSPDLIKDIKAGHCVRTIYLTAGDAGNDAPYWLAREKGSEAAYSLMTGIKQSVWIQRIVRLPGGQFITIDSPKGNNSISLIFMHLPDGNLKGEGFQTSNFESLESLESAQLQSITTVDHQSSYSADELNSALVALMHIYQPSELRTQSNYSGGHYPDHSDHRSVGRLVAKAFGQYELEQYSGYVSVPIKFYIGYPIHGFSPNISDGELSDKAAAFAAYAGYDGSVCRTFEQCRHTATYGAYLDRQYTNPD